MTTSTSGKFLSVMNTFELEAAHELSVKSYSSTTNNNDKSLTPLVKKTKSKVKTSNGKRFFNNPYYAGTPLAALAAAVKKTTNQAHQHNNNNSGTRSGNRSGNSSTTKLAARAYKLQLQAYQAAQAKLAAEQEAQDQEIVDVIVSAESSLSRGATLGNFAGDEPSSQQQQQQQHQQPKISVCSPPPLVAALEPVSAMMMTSKNDSSLFYGDRQGSSYVSHQQHNSNDLENFSFTSQQFIASQQQPQQPQFPVQQQQTLQQQQQHNFNQSVSRLSNSSGSEDERHNMMMMQNNNNSIFASRQNVVSVPQQQQQQHQFLYDQPEQPAFGQRFVNQQQLSQMTDDFIPQPKSSSTTNMTREQSSEQPQHKYPPNCSFVVVMFKYELCSFQCKFVVCEGDWVVVQADRGEHVGRVQSISAEPPVFHVPYQILRHANFTEIASVEANHVREQQAAQRIHQIAMDLQLPLAITDTEFYSDGNKMTVFFSSKTTVDFRELQRRVFREFRRRIWLINNAEVQYRNRNCRNRK